MSDFLKEYYGECTGALGFPMKELDARDLDNKLESGEYKPFKIFKGDAFECFFPKERADISVVSDGTVDKDKEIVNPKGVIWDSFRKNPVVTFGHNYGIPPIGKSQWQKLVGGGTWKAKTQYISKPESHPNEKEWFPDTIFHMVKEGMLPGKSIGGVSKWREATKEEIEKGITAVADETVIYEYSVVTVQSNNNAVVEAVSKGILNLSEEILQNYFPEAYAEVKEIIKSTKDDNNEEIIIKDYKTIEQYRKEREQKIQLHLESLYKRTPEVVDNALKRMLGKVS
jgi:hypothetical protein